jgi:choline transport protein
VFCICVSGLHYHNNQGYAKSRTGDEVKQVRTRVPQSIIIACTVNSVTLVVFATVLLFFCGSLDEVLTTPLPLLWIIFSITRSKTAANLLVIVLAAFFFLALFNIFASVSRLIWVFALDNGLPFSHIFAYVSVRTL